MDIIKLFVDNEENIEINIQGTIENPLFQANQIGKLLDIKKIHNTIKDFDDDEKISAHTMGRNGYDVSFLTEIGLYRLLGMSRKEKARKFQKWIATVVKEIRLNGKYELEKSLKETIENHKSELEQQRHKLLINDWCKTSGVYIGKVKELNDNNFIIKIGNTTDIKERAGRHKIDFGNFILLDFFEANRHINFEQSLLKDPFILQYKYDEDINGITSNETFCITKDIYRDIQQIALRKKKDYQGYTAEHYYNLEKQKNEIERIKEQKDLELLQLQRLQAQHNLPITVIKENPVPLKQEIKERKKTNGRKIQKYTPDGELVNTYTGLTNVIRTEVNEKLSEGGIKFAINKKIEYRGFRWVFLDKNLPDDTIQEIGENNTTIRRIPIDLIAMLDIDNKYIINVFENQNEAAKSRHLLTTSSIYNSIKNNVLCKGHRFNFYSKCSEEQKNKYLENNKLPENIRSFNSIKVKQINPITNEVIEVHNSFTDIRSKFQIGTKKIKQVINDDEVYKGYKWSY